MNPYSIPNLIAGIFCFLIGIIVFLKNRRSLVNLSFLILTTSASIWQIGTFGVLISNEVDMALRWCRFTYGGAIFIPIATYHFVIEFLKKSKQRKFVLYSYLMGAFIFLPLSQTNFFLSGVNKYFWGYWFKASFLHPFFLLFFILLMWVSFANLYFSYKRGQFPIEKLRIKFLFFAFIIAYIGSVDFPADYGIKIYPFGYFPLIIYLSIVAYAILKYRLMDITLAITRTGIFVAVYTLVLGLPFLLITLGKNWLIGFLGINWWFGPLVLLAVLATVGPFVYIYLQRRAEKIILREQYTYRKTLEQAAKELARIHSLKRLLDLITHIVTKTVRISHSAIYLYDENSRKFLLKSKRNFKEETLSLDKEDFLVKWLKDKRESLVCEEINRKFQETSNLSFKELEKKMQSLNANVIVPGFLRDKLLGFLVLGNKRSGKFYTPEDLNTLSVLANEAALAIENALIYENMEEEIRKRTEELVEIQKQLIQAEKMATVGTLAGGVAHEINNPLTAILTNVQMLLAESSVDSKLDKESLQLIEEATKRCRTIVKKLMTYAKRPLEVTEITEVNLLNVTKNVMSFLGYQLEQENIKIIVDTKEDVYKVLGNQNELEQVVTNIILNAKDAIKCIKKSGQINISISQDNDYIKMKIKDDGIGIPKEILPKIFDPFFTTKEVGKGTGLGLSICQAIVEKYNGKIMVESELNRGSTFTVELPKLNSRIENRLEESRGELINKFGDK